jgi:DNA-binding response OmpR family regulator
MQSTSHRLLLRAEITLVDTLVTYAYELTPTSVFVVTDWHTPPETPIRLRLSFLDVVEPIDLVARVTGFRSSGNPGDRSGMHLSFEEDPRVTALIATFESALETPHERKCRVLLIEDSRFTRDMFAYGLGNIAAGAFELDLAEDNERAWERLAEHTYDLVLVDYYLPAENGAQLVTRLRRDARFAHTPVVAISVGGRDARDAMIAAGADLFLDKPLALRDLSSTLKLVTLRDRQRAPAKTILVFDDSPVVLGVIRAALESEGYRVEVAADLPTFERHRASLAPDLILLDVQMPEAFGDDIALTLREWHSVRVPILLVSSLEEAELAKRAREAAVDGYITKAAGMRALVLRCKEMLGGAA